MRTRLKGRPSQPGTKQMNEQYGSKFIFAPYLHGAQLGKRLKIFEMIVEESPYSLARQNSKPDTVVSMLIGLKEGELAWNIERRW